MNAHQSAAPVNEFEKAPPQRRVRKEIADGIVEEDRVESLEALRLKDGRILADYRLECKRLLAHQLESPVRREDRAVAAVADVEREDQQLALLARPDERHRRDRGGYLFLLIG